VASTRLKLPVLELLCKCEVLGFLGTTNLNVHCAHCQFQVGAASGNLKYKWHEHCKFQPLTA
jgi:hypothetical protein